MNDSCLTIGKFAVRSWMVTAALATISVLYVAVIYLPNQRAIHELRTQLSQQQQHVMQAEQLETPLRQAELRLASTKQFTEGWLTCTPSPKSVTAVYAKLSTLADRSGVEVRRFEPQAVVELQTVCQHAVALEMSGEFAEVFEFVRQIEQLPNTVWLQEIHASPAADQPAILQVEMTLTIFSDRTEFDD